MGIFEKIHGEVAYLRGALRTLNRVKPITKTPEITICDRIAAVCAHYPDKIALISERETFTFREYDGRANRYARWALSLGLKKGEAVALMMPNRPEYLAIWLGVARAGGVTALINTNQTGAALAHSLSIVSPKAVIVAAELMDQYRSALPHLVDIAPLYVHGDDVSDGARLDTLIESFRPEPLGTGERVALTIEDRCLFIYTSGTTGMPKAANINHYRVSAMALGFSSVMNVGPGDRMYDCLPMYHSNGGILATCGVLIRGGTVIIREKFSAREFWSDVVKYRATLFFYIGELCRFLLQSPVSPDERSHRIRLICGNGLRPDIWEAFSKRFGIRRIMEFYGATEGNIALFNFASRPGAVGRIPKWAEKRFVVKVVQFDVEKEEPIRGADGFCIPCAPGEIGEIMGQIIDDPLAPANRFEGYAEKHASERKILRDVFARGDAWFRSGDLMMRDEDGYFYFIDRIGDTFRWKGENIATSQVAETVTTFEGVAEAAVYGVALPGHDGRAGMAAIVLEAGASLDVDGLRAHLRTHLPGPACPVFVRVRDALDKTGTFKLRKIDLVRDGFAPEESDDPVYVEDVAEGRYVLMDAARRALIASGAIRF
jgi:fatty-acyl-CoA synthase